MLEAEVLDNNSRSGSSSMAPAVAEMLAQKEQQISELRLQLQSALHTSNEVCLVSTCTTLYLTPDCRLMLIPLIAIQ